MGVKIGVTQIPVEGLVVGALAAALYEEAEDIMADSKANYVPVDTGTLRASGTVLPPELTGTHVVVTLGYGGAAQDYALPVHERLDVHHPHGQAKYLEAPVLAAIPQLGAKVAARAREHLA